MMPTALAPSSICAREPSELENFGKSVCICTSCDDCYKFRSPFDRSPFVKIGRSVEILSDPLCDHVFCRLFRAFSARASPSVRIVSSDTVVVVQHERIGRKSPDACFLRVLLRSASRSMISSWNLRLPVEKRNSSARGPRRVAFAVAESWQTV